MFNLNHLCEILGESIHLNLSCGISRAADWGSVVLLWGCCRLSCEKILVVVHCVVCCWFYHNFQRWMSRLGQRWRAQRSVITFVNCRIPWINRVLNACCAFGIYLTACLLWCLLVWLPVADISFNLCLCATCVHLHARVSITPLLCVMNVKLCLSTATWAMHSILIACLATELSPSSFFETWS